MRAGTVPGCHTASAMVGKFCLIRPERQKNTAFTDERVTNRRNRLEKLNGQSWERYILEHNGVQI